MPSLGWFRSNNGGGAWLAFFALACQLVLTFGHVHFAGVGAISAAWAVAANPAADETSVPTPPVQQRPVGLAQDFCAVCSNIGLANTLVLPAAPHSVSPPSIAANLQWLPAAGGPPSQRHFHFSARGPPCA
jgi:hypothetical protein